MRSHVVRLKIANKLAFDYPGKRTLEKALKPAAKVAANHKITRLLGYWLVWSQCEGGRSEIIDRGFLSRASAYATEADFAHVFGCTVEEFDPRDLPVYLFGE